MPGASAPALVAPQRSGVQSEQQQAAQRSVRVWEGTWPGSTAPLCLSHLGTFSPESVYRVYCCNMMIVELPGDVEAARNIGPLQGANPTVPEKSQSKHQVGTPRHPFTTFRNSPTHSDTASFPAGQSVEEAHFPASLPLAHWAPKSCAFRQCWHVWACDRPRGCVWQQLFPSSARRTSAAQNALRMAPQVQ